MSQANSFQYLKFKPIRFWKAHYPKNQPTPRKLTVNSHSPSTSAITKQAKLKHDNKVAKFLFFAYPSSCITCSSL